MAEKPIEFIKRFKDKPFTRWKGGCYRFYLHDNEVDFFHWIFENKLEKEVIFREDADDWNPSKKRYRIHFKTGEAFMGFKLTWL